MALVCVLTFALISTGYSLLNTTTISNHTVPLYIYYNDTIDFIDINLKLFEHQFALSVNYALQTINDDLDTDTNINYINICSFYQHNLASSYMTNKCSSAYQWSFSEQQLSANSAKSAISTQMNINIASASTSPETVIDKIIIIIININSTFNEYIEDCMNKQITFCSNTKYESTGKFVIINIKTELATIAYPAETNQDSMYWLRKIGLYLSDYLMYGVMFICIIFAIAAWLHALCKGYDCINITAVIVYAIYSWDFYADVVFCAHLATDQYFWLAIASAACVLVPLVTQFGTLLIYQDQWVRDELIKEKVSGWLVVWSRRLWLFSFLSGSAYGAIELLNSNIFALQFFSMGLTKKHLSQFNSKRLITNILMEVKYCICKVYMLL